MGWLDVRKSHVLLVGCTLHKDVRIAGGLLYWTIAPVGITCSRQSMQAMCALVLGAVCFIDFVCASRVRQDVPTMSFMRIVMQLVSFLDSGYIS